MRGQKHHSGKQEERILRDMQRERGPEKPKKEVETQREIEMETQREGSGHRERRGSARESLNAR